MTTDFILRTVTWNVGESSPPEDLTALLGLDRKELPDMYAIGLQELKSNTTTIISDSIFDDSWSKAITLTLSHRDYVRVKSLRLVGIHLSIYIERSQLLNITHMESEFTRTGLGGLWGNKGGVSIKLKCNGVNLTFVNSHFSAHTDNYSQRIEDFTQVLMTQRFRDPDCPNILDSDYAFWMGDLNFRLSDKLSNEEVRLKVKEGNYEQLLLHDQLNTARKHNLVFPNFEEGVITFPPTFKFDVDSDQYDTSIKNRVPAWCDRILWRVHRDAFSGTNLTVNQHEYSSLNQYTNSDHRPVFASFTVQVLKNSPALNLTVMFEPMKSWSRGKDQSFVYSVSKDFITSSRDWIGLFPVNFKTLEEYSTYIWAPRSGDDNDDGSFLYKAYFEERDLDKLASGKYLLLYFSSVRRCAVCCSDEIELLGGDQTTSSEDESMICPNEPYIDRQMVVQQEVHPTTQRSRPLNAEHPVLDEPCNLPIIPAVAMVTENIPEPMEKVTEDEKVPVVRSTPGEENKDKTSVKEEKELEVKELHNVVKVSELVKKIEKNVNGSAVEEVKVDQEIHVSVESPVESHMESREVHDSQQDLHLIHLMEMKSEMLDKVLDDSKKQPEEDSRNENISSSEFECSNFKSEEQKSLEELEQIATIKTDLKPNEDSDVEERIQIHDEIGIEKADDVDDSKDQCCVEKEDVCLIDSFDLKHEILEESKSSKSSSETSQSQVNEKVTPASKTFNKSSTEEVQSSDNVEKHVEEKNKAEENKVGDVVLEHSVGTDEGDVHKVIDHQGQDRIEHHLDHNLRKEDQIDAVDKSDDKDKEHEVDSRHHEELSVHSECDEKLEEFNDKPDACDQQVTIVVEDVVKVEKSHAESAIKPEEVLLTPDSDITDSNKEEPSQSDSITHSSSDFEIIHPPSKHSTLESFEDSYLEMRENALADEESQDKENIEKVKVQSAFSSSNVNDEEFIESVNAQLLDQNIKGFVDSLADFEDSTVNVENVKLEHGMKSLTDDGEKKEEDECVVVKEEIVFEKDDHPPPKLVSADHKNQLETEISGQPKIFVNKVEEFVDQVVTTAVQEAVTSYTGQQDDEVKQHDMTPLFQNVYSGKEVISTHEHHLENYEPREMAQEVGGESYKGAKLPIMEEFSTLQPIATHHVVDDHQQHLSSDQSDRRDIVMVEAFHQDIFDHPIPELKSEEVYHESHNETMETRKDEAKTSVIPQLAIHLQPPETPEKSDKHEETSETLEKELPTSLVSSQLERLVLSEKNHVTDPTTEHSQLELVKQEVEKVGKQEAVKQEALKHEIEIQEGGNDEMEENISETPNEPICTTGDTRSSDSNFFNAYMDLREKSLIEKQDKEDLKDAKKEEKSCEPSDVAAAEETLRTVDMDLVDKNLNDFNEDLALQETMKEDPKPHEVDGEYQAKKEVELLIKDSNLQTETHAVGDSQHHGISVEQDKKQETKEKENVSCDDLTKNLDGTLETRHVTPPIAAHQPSGEAGLSSSEAVLHVDEPSREKLELFNKKVEVKEEIHESTNQ